MAEPPDDLSVRDDERLLHRICPSDVFVNPDTGHTRPTSAAFRSTSNITSVAIASMVNGQELLKDYPDWKLVEIDVGTLRSLGCRIVRDPQPGYESHALVYGSAPNGRMTKSQAREIAERCRWVNTND